MKNIRYEIKTIITPSIYFDIPRADRIVKAEPLNGNYDTAGNNWNNKWRITYIHPICEVAGTN